MYDSSGPTIVLNPSLWTDRVEFTFYHEVTHHLLENDGTLISFLHDHIREDRPFHWTIERACNTGAAEFLVPRNSTLEIARTSNWDADLIRTVYREHSASWIACTLQIASVAPHSCLGLVCGPEAASGKASENMWGSQQKSRANIVVLHSLSSNSMKYWLAKGTRIPFDHTLSLTWGQGNDTDERDYIPYRSGRRQPCRCVGLRRSGIVLALLHAEDPMPPNQPLLFG